MLWASLRGASVKMRDDGAIPSLWYGGVVGARIVYLLGK